MKELCVTTDFYDDLIHAGRHYRKEDLDAMMAYAAGLGARRHEWILDTIWTLYDEDGPVGYDLLAEACEAAHRHGMRFDVVFKPFEGAIGNAALVVPHDMPRPPGVPLLDEIGGLVHNVRPFLAEHPEMRMARCADDNDPGGRIAAIRLVKRDDAPAEFGKDDLSLFTSNRNGGFQPYTGPMTMTESVEWRCLFPYRDCPSRILTLGGLELPADARYLMIRCRKKKGTFTNAVEQLVELVNEHGAVIPSTPSLRRVNPEGMWQRADHIARLNLTAYVRDPEVRALLADRAGFLDRCRDMYAFDAGWEEATLDKADEVVVARGNARHVIGVLNPVYPEVRAHWMDHVQFCIDRGVDGVNMRVADHNRPYEPWTYGFNPPTLEQMTDPANTAEAARINGDAYTRFLREAAELLHKNGKEIGVHVHGLIFRHDDRVPNNTPLPRNIAWQWETWIREFADYVEFRGANQLKQENIQLVTDRIGLAAREAGIPFIFQSGRGDAVHYDGPHYVLAREMDWVRTRPDISIYNLYEIACFSRMNSGDRFEGSPAIAELVREHWREKE
ncbi:hypothetical protein ACFLQL_04100 [Verrucomicrobiota bacterium]